MNTYSIAGLALLLVSLSAPAADRVCSTADFQACKTCSQLEAAVDYQNPSAGDYYRGADWNGLYAAYVANCPLIATKLIRAGADPSSGGLMGSMIMSVADKWPHDDVSINETWAALLLLAGASVDAPLDRMDGTTKEVLARESWYVPDYPNLLVLFQK